MSPIDGRFELWSKPLAKPLHQPAAVALVDGPFPWDVAVPIGAKIAGPFPTPKRLQRRVIATGATLTVLLLHASALLLWRSAPPSPAAEVPGSDAGSGGVSVSLVSGVPGGAFANKTAVENIDPETQKGAQPSTSDMTAPAPDVVGQAGGEDAANADGHTVGVIGEGSKADGAGSVSTGYDPWAHASLAPAAFAKASEPGLWDQVKRCYHSASTSSVSLTVVLDDEGRFVDAYRSFIPINAPSADETKTTADMIAALRACSPYTGVKGGIERRLTLASPAAKTQPPESKAIGEAAQGRAPAT